MSYKSSLMPPYAILLSDHHYSILLEKTASESDAYLSLLDATNPTPTKHRGIICSETAANCWLWRPYFVRTLLPKYRGRSKGRRNALKLSQHKDNA